MKIKSLIAVIIIVALFIAAYFYYKNNFNTSSKVAELIDYDKKAWSIKPKRALIIVNFNKLKSGALEDTLSLNYLTVGKLAIFQGDIILADTNHIHLGFAKALKTEAFFTLETLWDDKTVPYEFDASLDNEAKTIVMQAMSEWTSATKIIKFREKVDADLNYVHFIAGHGYASSIGMVGSLQNIIVASVPNKGNVMHEIGHTLGLWHEHCRPDRSKYISIIDENIDPLYTCQFIQPINDVTTLNTSYDLNSIMHYPTNAFGIAGLETIKVLVPGKFNLGNRDSLSKGDIQGMIKLYTERGSNNPNINFHQSKIVCKE